MDALLANFLLRACFTSRQGFLIEGRIYKGIGLTRDKIIPFIKAFIFSDPFHIQNLITHAYLVYLKYTM